MLDQLIQISGFALALGIPLVYWLLYRRRTAKAKRTLEQSIAAGLTEPVSLHPKIDPNSCIATGACISACPEGKILGIIGTRAELISPTKCIGHGACQMACPTSAISLVFGTERRGVEIPHVKETFETNVDGVYIAGELGGMGLIRNAVTQGREAIEYLSKTIKDKRADRYDVLIIGAGPAGISATLEAKKRNLNYLTLEQEGDVGGTVLSYPRQKLVMTQPMEIPLYGKYQRREISKEELVDLWQEVMTTTGIAVHCSQKVETVERCEDGYRVTTNRGIYEASKVLLATGRRGSPRKLGVPGERATKVAYKLLEPEQYRNRKLLVVGGGDSAVEAAVALGEQEGTTVTISYRKDLFSRIKEGNRERIERAISAGWVTAIMESEVVEIREREVVLGKNGEEIKLENDFVFVFIGGELPTAFLKSIGISMERKFGER